MPGGEFGSSLSMNSLSVPGLEQHGITFKAVDKPRKPVADERMIIGKRDFVLFGTVIVLSNGDFEGMLEWRFH